MEEEFGTLMIRVYTSKAQLPVEDATVVVTREARGNKYELIMVQSTDRNGMLPPISVPTPPKWESTEPVPGMKPFAVCQVWAEHSGYAILMVDGVQVFPGVETIQDMPLLPLSEGETSFQSREQWDIPPQNL